MARIGRWATPDPAEIHALKGGEALNAYHYVSGNLLQARDPLGLEDVQRGDGTSGGENPASTSATSTSRPATPAAAPSGGGPGLLERAGQWLSSLFLDSVPPAATNYARRGTPEFSGADRTPGGGAQVLEHQANRLAQQNDVASAHLSFWANNTARSIGGALEVGGGFASLAHYGVSLGTPALRAPSLLSERTGSVQGSAAKGAGGGTTRLYRAVTPAELADVQATGQLINRGSAEGKYFTTSAEAASSYARQAVRGFGDKPYTLISTAIRSSAITPAMRATVDRGVPAVVVPDAMLPSLVPRIENFMAVP